MTSSLVPFVTTAWAIFLAELGDKTLYTVVVLSSEGSPLAVGFGAALAFVAQCAIAVAAGRAFALLPHLAVRIVTGVLFAIFGVVLLVHRPREEEHRRKRSERGPFLSALVLVFLAEWGDLTQIGTAALAARFRAPVRVFLGAVVGLWAGTAIAVALGRLLGARLPARKLRIAAGVVFLAVAAWTLAVG